MGLATEKKVNLHGVRNSFVGSHTSPSVTYLLSNEGKIGIHLLLHVLWLSQTGHFTCVFLHF
jgi:hypothetical protein